MKCAQILQEKCVEDLVSFYVNLQHSVSQNELRYILHSLVSLDARSGQSRRVSIEFHLFLRNIYISVLSRGPDQDSSVLLSAAWIPRSSQL